MTSFAPIPLRPTSEGGRQRVTLKTGLPPGAPPYYVFLDFDNTITTRDTLHILAGVSAAMQPTRELAYELREQWEQCKDLYMLDYERFQEDYDYPKELRCDIDVEISYQRALREVELISTMRLNHREIFRRSPLSRYRNVGWYVLGVAAVRQHLVKARMGFQEFIDALDQRNVNEIASEHSRWNVISVNFSRNFIRGCIEQLLPQKEDWEDVNVICNDIDGEGRIIGPEGRLDGEERRMLSSEDKLAAMREVVSWGMPENTVTIYIGDSLTDLECLREASVGICMCTNGQGPLNEAFERFGMRVLHISQYRKDRPYQKYYWANNFEEITISRLMRPWLPLTTEENASDARDEEELQRGWALFRERFGEPFVNGTNASVEEPDAPPSQNQPNSSTTEQVTLSMATCPDTPTTDTALESDESLPEAEADDVVTAGNTEEDTEETENTDALFDRIDMALRELAIDGQGEES